MKSKALNQTLKDDKTIINIQDIHMYFLFKFN